jgi:hypothetical protein
VNLASRPVFTYGVYVLLSWQSSVLPALFPASGLHLSTAGTGSSGSGPRLSPSVSRDEIEESASPPEGSASIGRPSMLLLAGLPARAAVREQPWASTDEVHPATRFCSPRPPLKESLASSFR